jgi:hypothetical protein
MIGNTDWWVSTQHNVILFTYGHSSFPFPIPYDFDYAGVINTPYATTHNTVPISNVQQRYYKGFCQSMDTYEETIEQFNNLKDAIYKLYRNSVHLKESQKKSTLKYYDSFYKIINDPKSVRRYFFENCTPDQARN